METISFSNNADLYQYLLSLIARLKERGFVELSEILEFAASHASAMSTEFLGESRIALRQLLERNHGALTTDERCEVLNSLKQLDAAFEKR
jgi:hypothetical protein